MEPAVLIIRNGKFQLFRWSGGSGQWRPVFVEQLINGVTLGSIYAIVALGYTLVFGVLDIINMAHGEIFMFGAFIGMVIVTKMNAPLAVAFLGAVAVTAALGYLLERIATAPRKATAS